MVYTDEDLAARKKAWLEERKTVVTATQAAILWNAHCGAKNYKGSTPYDVWQEKVGQSKPLEDNIHMWLGKSLETPIAEWLAGQLGATLRMPEPYTLVRSQRYDWLAATPDAYLLIDGAEELAEIKVSGVHEDWGPTITGEVPGRVLGQAAWQMAVTDMEACHVGALIFEPVTYGRKARVKKELRRYRLQRVKIVEDYMIHVVGEWWKRHVIGGYPPPKEM